MDSYVFSSTVIGSNSIILVRHGVTDWSLSDRRLGSSDIPLNDEGRLQARALSGALVDVPITRAYSSDLSRSTETARLIVESHGIAVIQDARLRERDHGRFEGTVRERVHGMDVTSQLSPVEMAQAGVEPIEEAWNRVLAAYAEIRDASKLGPVVIVSHYGPIRMILAHALGLGAEDRRRVEADCGCMSVIRANGSVDQLILMNCPPPSQLAHPMPARPH